MAHFAQIENGKVIQVIVIDNDKILENGVESEAKGIAFCKSLLGQDTEWVQTSYNGNLRYNYAGIGFDWDANNNAFIPPKPINNAIDENGNELQGEWVLNTNTFKWEFN